MRKKHSPQPRNPWYQTLALVFRLTEDQAAQRIRLDQYSNWGRYQDWFPMNVRGVYRWVVGDNEPMFEPR